MPRQKSIDYSLLIASFLLYGFIGFGVERYETQPLLLAYSAVFVIYLYLAFKSRDDSINFWFYGAILFRIVMLFCIPSLSDDFYRFVWDGRLLAAGYHPFAEVPAFYMQHNLHIPGINEELFLKLNSPDYFTIYPPAAQFIFWLAVKISPESIYGSMLVMKVILFISEIGSLLVIRNLLFQFNLPAKRILLYALNPLIILELVGNIHLEAVLIFFLLLAILLLCSRKLIPGGVSFSIAICVKLTPLMLMPALVPRLGWRKAMTFYLIVGATCVILFLPLWDKEIIFGFQHSLAYYFKKFEFNASIYYLVRAWGYWYYGYNLIQTAGWVLGIGSFLIIIFFSVVRLRYAVGISKVATRILDQGLLLRFVLILLTYFLFTTTLHPWYIAPLLVISIFTEFRFAVLWSALIFLTYAGYSMEGFQENLFIIFIEYIFVLGYLAYELLWKRKYLLQAS
ncbi:MAG: hypothetical protein OEV74_06030 [Cyclobacteriaceae bacterium]|nr:hypothetical protein [Cyclobacteriaceae bacterium]